MNIWNFNDSLMQDYPILHSPDDQPTRKTMILSSHGSSQNVAHVWAEKKR